MTLLYKGPGIGGQAFHKTVFMLHRHGPLCNTALELVPPKWANSQNSCPPDFGQWACHDYLDWVRYWPVEIGILALYSQPVTNLHLSHEFSCWSNVSHLGLDQDLTILWPRCDQCLSQKFTERYIILSALGFSPDVDRGTYEQPIYHPSQIKTET